MSFGKKRVIDLKEYGVEGTIVLSSPTFRRINQMNNAIGSMVELVNGELTLKSGAIPLGDINVLSVLAFVESAPFQTNMEQFYKFTDKVDELTGMGQELFKRMQQESVSISRGEDSPFVDSLPAETVNSD